MHFVPENPHPAGDNLNSYTRKGKPMEVYWCTTGLARSVWWAHVSCIFVATHTCVYAHTKSQGLKSLQAGSWYPCFVLLMVLFRFYYSEYLTHLCSQRRLYPARRLLWNATRYSFPFSNPILPLLSATATVSNCFLLSYFSFFPLPFSSFLLWSIFLQQTNDRHWWTQRSIQRPHTQHKREKNKSWCFLMKNLFFNKTQKAIKLR